jgi:hypothetical protein
MHEGADDVVDTRGLRSRRRQSTTPTSRAIRCTFVAHPSSVSVEVNIGVRWPTALTDDSYPARLIRNGESAAPLM